MRIAYAALLLAACGGGTTTPTAPDAGEPVDPLVGIGTVERVDDGYQFLEGPQWLDGDGVLLFSDIPADTIYQLAPPATITVFRMPSGMANGNGLTAGGDLLSAEHGNRRVSITEDGVVSTLADAYQAARLNSPNDVVARDDGTVYFTDPPYGISDSDRELDFMGTFRVPPGGAPVAEVMGPLTARPNGLALAPDESILYVDDTDGGVVRAYDLAADGALSGERTLSSDVPGADGMAIDADGNLFVTTEDGIRVIAPDGTTWGTIAVPERPANCAFGGTDHRTLYITAQSGLYVVTLANPGLPAR